MKTTAAYVALVTALAIIGHGPHAQARGYEQTLGQQAFHAPSGDGVIDRVRWRGLLKVGVGLFEPWVMCGTNGDLIGYEVDVARELADDIGVRIQFVRTDWYYIVPALIEEEYDVVISGMGITPQRSLYVNFSIPYAEFGTAIVANTELTTGLTAPEDFDDPDVVFGARAGTIPQQVVGEHFPQAMLRVFDSDSELLQALLEGELHAASVDQVKATRWLDAHPEVLHRPFDTLFNKTAEAMALRKGDVDGLNVLDSWIAHHRTSGWLGERRHYWFETREWADQLASDPTVVAECNESFEPNPY